MDSIEGSIEANGPGGGGGPGPDFGNGGNSGGLDSTGSGVGAIDLSGSEPGIDFSAAGLGLAGTIASLGNLAMGNPFAAITLLTSAGMAYGPAVAATRQAISFAYSQDQAIANAQMTAFTQ